MYRNIALFIFLAVIAASCAKEQPYFSFETAGVEIIKDSTLQLKVVSSGMEEATIEWSSSDVSVVTVDQAGVAIAQEYGEAVITAVCSGYEAKCRVTVVTPSVTSVRLDKEELEMAVLDEYRLSYSLLPEDAVPESVEWSSSDENVVTVEGAGKLIAKAVGEAVVSLVIDGVQAQCSVSVVNKAKVGSFYYSDGTFSDVLDNSKEVIGVVFWTGDPTGMDETLAKEHPECTNGLVVSINDAEGFFQWQEPVCNVSDWVVENTEYFTLIAGQLMGDNLNKTVGYNNTQALKAFNDDAASNGMKVTPIEALNEFEAANEAPEGTSGWYMPSAKELSLICTGTFNSSLFEISSVMVDNRDLLNESLGQINGADTFISSVYWSSSEADDYGAVTVFFGSGVVVNGQKQNEAKVRFVLAF